MKEALLHTPEGVRDIYGEECREKQALIENLTNACRLYGYDSIQTPTMEFLMYLAKREVQCHLTNSLNFLTDMEIQLS